MRIYTPTREPEDWRRLLGSPSEHWRPGYSAYALAQSWESSVGLPAEIEKALRDSGDPALADLEVVAAFPEHETKVPGKGRPSQTDLLVLGRGTKGHVVLAVEGKVSEDFGPTVAEWLAKSDGARSAANREDRIAGVCELLGVQREGIEGLRYQLFHRTAAALLEARRVGATSAVMLVHSFSPTAEHLDDFHAFAGRMELVVEPGHVTFASEIDGIRLSLGWVTGSARFLEKREPVPTAVGVDACKDGWLAAWRTPGGRIRAASYGTLKEVLGAFPSALLGVDIPIGLVSRCSERRECDIRVRGLLGARGASVFNAPCREAVQQYVEGGGDLNTVRVRMSAQALGFLPKVAEVDRVMRSSPRLQSRVREVHPELSFAQMAGGRGDPRPLAHPKKDGRGMLERLALLQNEGYVLDALGVDEGLGHQFAVDDLLDAAAACWSAERIRFAGRRATTRALPSRPVTDSHGLAMQIWR